MSRKQSEEFPVGPFSGHFALEQFARIQAWLASGEDDPLIFFDEIPMNLISEGFEIFCETEKIDPTLITTSRSLMACCINLLRKSFRLRSAAGESADNIEPDLLELDDEDENNADQVDDSLIEITAEDVAGKFSRLFQRTAKSYLRSKLLTRLLNSRLIFEERGQIRRLEVRGGSIVSSIEPTPLPTDTDPLAWAALDILTYDRMSVLLAEIGRMRSAGQNVIIEPQLTLNLVSHPVV